MIPQTLLLTEFPAGGWYEAYGEPLLLIALFLGFTALLLVLNRYRKGYQRKPQTGKAELRYDRLSEMMVKQVKALIREHLGQENPGPAKTVDAPEQPAGHLPEQVPEAAQAEKVQPDHSPLVPEEGPVTLELTVPPQQTTPAIMEDSRLWYAKFPADEHRFSGQMLVSEQDGEQAYELEIRGDSGIYRVTRHEGAQKYALSEDKYLLACTYDQLPNNRSQVVIVTDRPGRISRNGADWQIDEKARIKFL